jgi:hypothetical protein
MDTTSFPTMRADAHSGEQFFVEVFEIECHTLIHFVKPTC